MLTLPFITLQLATFDGKTCLWYHDRQTDKRTAFVLENDDTVTKYMFDGINEESVAKVIRDVDLVRALKNIVESVKAFKV